MRVAEAAEEPTADKVLTSKHVFEVGEWLGKIPISDGLRQEFFNLEWVKVGFVVLFSDFELTGYKIGGLPWQNIAQFNESVDTLPHGPEWIRQMITIQGNAGVEKLDLWMRDVLEVVHQLISDPRFRRHMRYRPEQHWLKDRQGKTGVYSEMWTGKWWWCIQVCPNTRAGQSFVLI
jgi:hypothetical protein